MEDDMKQCGGIKFVGVFLLILLSIVIPGEKLARAQTSTGITSIVSIATDGTQGNFNSLYPRISSNGRFIVFQSDATNLV